MKIIAGLFACMAVLALGACSEAPQGDGASTPEAAAGFHVPVAYEKLANGLKVVLSEDHSVPTVTVGVYYNIGFRIEPRGRTGFAHLFEHMMFQGSGNLGKSEFIQLIQGVGGVLNGSTRFDFTNYFEVVPSHKLEPILWAEADRMRGLDINQDNLTNQKGVVKNEVKVNVLNRPYGGFPWLDMPQYANVNWNNAHNFYGDLAELDAATLDDVQAFFNTYYSPNNAVLVVAGDFDPALAMAQIEQYFGDIPPGEPPPPVDISEPEQTAEKTASKDDKLAPRPALAFSYHMPGRGTPEYYAMGILDQVLLQGEDSLLHQALVKDAGITGDVSGGINMLGNMFNYNGPMLWTAGLIHDPAHTPEDIMELIDGVMAKVAQDGVSEQDLERSMRKMRSAFYDTVGSSTRFGLVDLLASFALFDDDPGRINTIEDGFALVTPELIRQTARKYLNRSNRTVLTIVPGAAATPGKPS